MKQILIVFLVLAAASCAPRLSTEDTLVVERLWLRLHQPMPLTLAARLSIHVEGAKTTGRVLADLAGAPEGVLRLDVFSSMGSPLAFAEEAPSGVAIYVLETNTAYTTDDPRHAWRLHGIPLAMSVSQVAHLLLGDWSTILPQAYHSARTTHGGVEFVFTSGMVDRLVVAADGSMIHAKGKGWELTADAPNPTDGRFSRLTYISTAHGTATVRVKELATDVPQPPALIIPPSARYESLPKESL